MIQGTLIIIGIALYSWLIVWAANNYPNVAWGVFFVTTTVVFLLFTAGERNADQ